MHWKKSSMKLWKSSLWSKKEWEKILMNVSSKWHKQTLQLVTSVLQYVTELRQKLMSAWILQLKILLVSFSLTLSYVVLVNKMMNCLLVSLVVAKLLIELKLLLQNIYNL
jgi:hypothetical protein